MVKKILVIDDEPDIGELIRDCLSFKDLEVFIAPNAEEGIALAQKEKPDLILLDILLPKVGGLECLRRLKQTLPDVVVVVLSGVQDENIATEAIRRGAYDYITKPFNLSQFEKQILPRIFHE
ncbi:MAG: response regulator [Candidatus Omnitrophica bacterium]|nr:response regulator [Candidatus Omnitrophota bacterium]